MVAEQVRSLGAKASLLLEPEGRNTAPAIALAAIEIMKQDYTGVMLVLASDHVIQKESAFHEAVEQAMPAVEKGQLVTFGIVPHTPETGYGYIKSGDTVHSYAKTVEAFVEKPDLETAQQYIDSGDYLWNSGMFMFKASRYVDALKKHAPEIYNACESAMNGASLDLDFIRPDRDAFIACPDDSIDYAVMEKTSSAVVIPLDAGWSDVGSYAALWDVSDKTAQNNVCKGDVISVDTTNSYLHSENKLIATVGIDNLVVVDTSDAILVAQKDQVQK